MEVPGMNPLQNRFQVPGQTPPAGPQPQVPDLILDAPQNRTPTAQPQAPASTTLPYQAPAQAVVNQVYQDMTSALMEMGMPATQQNQQMASLLAGYGNAVNTQTMGILKQAMQGLSDKSPATMEAAVILLTQDLPVTDQTAAAIKQFVNSAPLPEQLQNLPKQMEGSLQQLQQAAQSAQPEAMAQGQLTAGQAGQTAQGAQTQPPAQAGQAPVPAEAAANQPQPSQTLPTPAPAQAAPQAAGQGQLNVTGQTAAQAGAQIPGQAQTVAQQAGQQIVQTIQNGQAMIQAAPMAANIQQAAGQAQTIENRGDGVARLSERSTAEKVAVPDTPTENLPAIEEVDSKQGQAGQSNQVAQHLPAARSNDQSALQQLYLHLRGGETTVEKVGPGGAASIQTPEEAVLRLLTVMQELGQIAGHLAENMQLRDFSHLYIQHQQILQLTGLLEHKLQEFHQLFAKAFPELSQDVQKLLNSEGHDMFTKLAQLIDENQTKIHARLHLPGDNQAQASVLNTLSQLMQQVGVQVERVEANLVARELLTQNLPIHVVPLTIHHHGQTYPAEIFVQQDYDPNDSRSGPDGGRPMKVTLTLETKNMGRVSVDLAALRDDMTVDLKVQTRRIKVLVDEQLKDLRIRVEKEGDYKVSHLGCRVVPDLESRQSMLLPPKRVIRSLRRVEGVV